MQNHALTYKRRECIHRQMNTHQHAHTVHAFTHTSGQINTRSHSYMKSNPNWDNTEANEKPFPVCLIGLSHGAGLTGWHIHQWLYHPRSSLTAPSLLGIDMWSSYLPTKVRFMPLLHPLVERQAEVLWYLCAGAQGKKYRKERKRHKFHTWKCKWNWHCSWIKG